MKRLYGAERDAARMYECLTTPARGTYDAKKSQLLLSPTLNQFRDALAAILFDEGLDVFTFFFAGHGGVKSGSYYVCLSDARFDRMSATALPLNVLFTALNESRPTQVNIIIDACNAGGLVMDLGTLLKHELIGAKNSPSISLLAAASSDQYASESTDGGVVSDLLLAYLSGEKKLNSTARYLDLADVGKAIASELDPERDQRPTYWALNLYGQSKFSSNPHFSDTPELHAASVYETLPLLIRDKISEHADALWDEYRAISDDPDGRRLAKTLRTVIAVIQDDHVAVAGFVEGITGNLEQQAAKSRDLFGPVTATSTLIAVLLDFIEHPSIRTTIQRLIARRRDALDEALAHVEQRLQEDQYYLLGSSELTADLFFLPLRICRVLGYAWAEVLLAHIAEADSTEAARRAAALTSAIFLSYRNSFVAVSDEQAAYLYAITRGARAAAVESVVAPAIEGIFADVVKHRGNVANAHLEASNIFRFLLARYHNSERAIPEVLATPSQLLAVMLSTRNPVINEGEWDRQLRSLDHQSLVVFLPKVLTDFGLELIPDGVNNVFQIGHGIWTFSDFRKEFETQCLPTIKADTKSTDPDVQAVALISSLVMPDRVPWFIENAAL